MSRLAVLAIYVSVLNKVPVSFPLHSRHILLCKLADNPSDVTRSFLETKAFSYVPQV